MAKLQLPEDFEDILVELADAKAEFVLIGGWAMAAHGRPRAEALLRNKRAAGRHKDLDDVEWLEATES